MNVQLINDDCLLAMKDIPTGSVDMILADPPYQITACKWDSIIDLELMWEQLKRIIKPNGAIVLFGSEPFSSHLRISNLKQYKYDWKWDKVVGSNFVNAKIMPLKAYEDIIVFLMPNNTYNPQMVKRDSKNHRISGKKIKKVCEINALDNIQGVKSERLKYPTTKIEINRLNAELNYKHIIHPAQKPVALMEYLIKTYTNEGEAVLDFTMGSGTTGVACKHLKRNFIGIELDKEYYDIATKRITEATHLTQQAKQPA